MHYHILLTESCNSQCRYCYGKSQQEPNILQEKFKFDFLSPEFSKIDVEQLKVFLDKDKSPIIIFYGGEPLLNLEKLKEIMDKIKLPYRMQTNGLLLDKLESKYINRIDKILVSLDGNEQRTDYNRGKGTYKKVLSNIQLLKQNRYKGELIARMTISEFPDIYEQVKHLLSIGFNSIHWQLDAGFYSSDYNEEKFKQFTIDYNKSISQLIKFWLDEMKQGKVLKLYPFLAIVHSLLKKETSLLRCGAGHSGYAITTSGKIVACPIMNCMKDFELGDLASNPNDLKKFAIIGNCTSCGVLGLCGGRCLYWNRTKLWPESGNNLICSTIKRLINELKNSLKEIKGLIEQGTIKESDFNYEKYFGPEIIP